MTFNILKPQDLDKLQEKLKVTQRLLDKLDLEFSLPHNQNKDFKQFLDKSTSTLNIYELCGNEFCFELDLLQLPIVSLFFKRYTLGYHRQISCFLKVLSECPQYFLPKNVTEPDKQAKAKPEEDAEKSVMKKDQKFEQSNILLRNQVALLSSNNDLLLRQNQQLKEMVSKFEKEKKDLEEELIRTVKSTIISQNEYMEGSTANKNKGLMSVDEFLASLKKSPAPTAKNAYGNREEAQKTSKFSASKTPLLAKDEEHKKMDEDELDFEEMKRVLEKRDKTFEKVKDSGVSKELKQVLKGIAKKKPVEVFQKISFHEEEDGEGKEEGSPLTSTMKKKVSILANGARNPTKKEAKKAMTTIHLPTSTQKVSYREVGTQVYNIKFANILNIISFRIASLIN